MTNSESEKSGDADTQGIDDEQLPEDLRPSEDNPLAVSLEERDDARDVDELDMKGGRTPEESSSDDDGAEGADGASGAEGDTGDDDARS